MTERGVLVDAPYRRRKVTEPVFTEPSNLASFLRRTVVFPEAGAVALSQPQSVPLFTAARNASLRTDSALATLALRTRRGVFSSDTFESLQHTIFQSLSGDPVFYLSGKYWQEQGESMPLVTQNESVFQSLVKPVKKTELKVDRGNYLQTGNNIRQILEGSDEPLSIETIASLVYPHILSRDDAVKKTEKAVACMQRIIFPLTKKELINRGIQGERPEIDDMEMTSLSRMLYDEETIERPEESVVYTRFTIEPFFGPIHP